MAADPLDDIDAAGEDLLRLYEMAGVVALILTYDGKSVTVRYQNADDVEWMCRKVAEQYTVPDGQKIN